MSKKSKLLVAIQFLSLLFFGFNGNLIGTGFFLLIQVFAIFIGISAIYVMKLGNFNIQPEVKETAIFITRGLYKIIRNPMYVSLITFFGISVLHYFNMVRLIIYLLLVISLLLKIFDEEKYLEHRFKEKYIAFKAKTYRLIPFIF
jgi:protein-S-isoprenylcysteine O-methyltransferase Ste14